MIKDIVQVIAAVVLSTVFFIAIIRYVKPRRSQAEFIFGLLNSISKSYDPE